MKPYQQPPKTDAADFLAMWDEKEKYLPVYRAFLAACEHYKITESQAYDILAEDAQRAEYIAKEMEGKL